MAKLSIKIACVAAILLAFSGCGRSDARIVGKWQACGDERQHLEFFADGKCLEGDSTEMREWTLVGGKLSFPKEEAAMKPEAKPFLSTIRISFPDKDHMDWAITYKAIDRSQVAQPKKRQKGESPPSEPPKMREQTTTIRYERVTAFKREEQRSTVVISPEAPLACHSRAAA